MARWKCEVEGCEASALNDELRCKKHLEKEVPVVNEFEIVTMDEIPKFRVVNEKAYKIAMTIKTLQPGHALKANGIAQGQVHTIWDYCRKLELKVKYRRFSGFVYFWNIGPTEKIGTEKK